MPTQCYRLVFPNSSNTPGIVLKVGARSQSIIDKTDTYHFEGKGPYVMFYKNRITDETRTLGEIIGTFSLKGLELKILGDQYLRLTKITKEEADKILKSRKNPDGWRKIKD